MMMLGSKDALRIVPYFASSYSLRSVLNVCHWHTAPYNLAQYSHIVKLELSFYDFAPVGAKRTSTGYSAPYRTGH